LKKFKEEKEREKKEKLIHEQKLKEQLLQKQEKEKDLKAEKVRQELEIQRKQEEQQKQQQLLHQQKLQKQQADKLKQKKAADEAKRRQAEETKAEALRREQASAAERLRLKELQLEKIEKKAILIVESRIVSQMWTQWQDLTIRRLEVTKRRQLQLIFGVWRRQFGIVRERREKLDAQLMAIDFNSPHKSDRSLKIKEPVDRTRLRLVAKKRVATFSQDHNFISVFGGIKTSLSAAKQCLFKDMSPKSPLLCPALAVGSGLLQVQSEYMRQQVFGAESKIGELWSHDLFFHLAIVSSCRKFHRGTVTGASTWDHNHCLLPSVIRSILCNETMPQSTEESTIANYDEMVPCLMGVESGHTTRHMRRVRLRIEDYPCGTSPQSSSTDEVFGNMPFDALKMLSAALVVVPDIMSCLLNDDGLSAPPNIKLQHLLWHLSEHATPVKRMRVQGFKSPDDDRFRNDSTGEVNSNMLAIVEGFLSGVLDACVPLVQQDIPIVLVLTRETIDFDKNETRDDSTPSHQRLSDPAEFDKVSDNDRTEKLLVSLFTELLSQRSNMAVNNIAQSFCIHANILNSDLHNTHCELFSSARPQQFSELSGVVASCGRCLFAALDVLSLASRPIPLVERVDVACWAEEVMLDALWRNSNIDESSNKSGIELLSAGNRQLSRSAGLGDTRHFNITSILREIIDEVNGALRDVCLARIADTLQTTLTSQELLGQSIFPFDLTKFMSTSVRLGKGDGDGLYGSHVVKGLIYNNMSDRRTHSCGPISSCLPVEWNQAAYLQSVQDKVVQVLCLPLIDRGCVDSRGYADLLVDQGWYIDASLKSKLDDILNRLHDDFEVFQSFSMSTSALVLSQATPNRRIHDQWTMINLNILTLKRLLSRIIQLQCEGSRDGILEEDVYLLVTPADDCILSDASSHAILCNSQDSTIQFHLPACPHPGNQPADDDRHSEVGVEIWNNVEQSRCKRPHLRDGAWGEESYVGEVDDNFQGDKKKSRLVVSSSPSSMSSSHRGDAAMDTFLPRMGYKQEVYEEVKQLGQECKEEIEEALSLEKKLALSLLNDETGSSHGFNTYRSTASSLWTGGRSYLSSVDDGYPNSKHSMSFDRQYPLDHSVSDLEHTLTKENMSVNQEITPSSALDMISQFREERLDLNAWMAKLE